MASGCDDARPVGDIVQRETRLESLSRQFFDRLAKLGHSEDLVDVSREMDNLLHLHDAYFPELEVMASETAQAFKRHLNRQTPGINAPCHGCGRTFNLIYMRLC